IILTFFLVWAVCATAVDPGGAFKSIGGLAIGPTITIDVLMGGPLTGAAMNPARAFGPEVWSGMWGEAWIYYLAPAIGWLIAALAYEYPYLRPARPSVVGTPESGVDDPRPSASARSGSRAAACAAPRRRATRLSAPTGAAARRSPCSGSRARSAEA